MIDIGQIQETAPHPADAAVRPAAHATSQATSQVASQPASQPTLHPGAQPTPQSASQPSPWAAGAGPDPGSRRAEIGVIGGSGFYALFDDGHSAGVPVQTPFGPTSDPVTLGEVAGRQVAFLPRHGRDHRYPPHRIPYRANLWALRSLGVTQVLAPCAVGGLRPELGPGSLVVPDQLVDRTSGRTQTFHDSGVVHVSFADPYCPDGRAAAVSRGRISGWPVTDGGTMVVVEGPRFSTRAESVWFAAMGWDVVNMTGHPEAVLARELALCYTALALVTDLDAGVEAGHAVSQQDVFQVFAANTGRLRTLVTDIVAHLPTARACDCRLALDGMTVDLPLPGPAQ